MIIIFKNGLQKYKIDVILDLVFIIQLGIQKILPTIKC